MGNEYGLLLPRNRAIAFESYELSYYDSLVGYGGSAFDVCVLDGSFFQKGDSHSQNLARKPVAMLKSDVASGLQGIAIKQGIVSNAAWNFVSGGGVWLASGGGIVASGPIASGDWVVKLGTATTKTVLEFAPSDPLQLG